MPWHKNYIILLQNAKKCRYRFSLLVDELRGAESDAYRTTILGFINSIILYTDRIEDRVRIRNEFIGKLILIFYIWQFALTTTHVLAKHFLSVENSVAIVIKPNIFMQITFKIVLRIANYATIEGILASYFIHIFLLSSNVHFHKKMCRL